MARRLLQIFDSSLGNKGRHRSIQKGDDVQSLCPICLEVGVEKKLVVASLDQKFACCMKWHSKFYNFRESDIDGRKHLVSDQADEICAAIRKGQNDNKS